MPPRKQAYSRRAAPQQPPDAAPAAPPTLKTSGVTGTDLIRVLAKPGSGIFRDGMTVGEFIASVPNRGNALRLLYRCCKAGTIGFEQGGSGEVAP